MSEDTKKFLIGNLCITFVIISITAAFSFGHYSWVQFQLECMKTISISECRNSN